MQFYPEEAEINKLDSISDKDIDLMDQRMMDAVIKHGDQSPEARKAFRLAKRMRYRRLALDNRSRRNANTNR